ncbi:hypothetical protein AB0N24_15090 [Arthrobacter sp. NPDC093128]|uniref:hypothetical protein n=1 Tax=Arthrobacter sp. NPDC093128 TaxID=3154979 RepID=UPI00342D7487
MTSRECHVSSAAAPLPQVPFTDPEIGSVGITAAAARRSGIDARIVATTKLGTSPAPVRGLRLHGHCQAALTPSAQPSTELPTGARLAAPFA